MTAPTHDEDEAKLRHFLRVKPYHTGFHLPPEARKQPIEPWWFVDESAVERYEEVEHCLFCRECNKGPIDHGHTYHKLLIDYQADPLHSVQALCSTHCRNCGKGQMYAVEKLDWNIQNEKVVSTLLRHTSVGRRVSDIEAAMESLKPYPPAHWAKQMAASQAAQAGGLAGLLGSAQAAYGQALSNQMGNLGGQHMVPSPVSAGQGKTP